LKNNFFDTIECSISVDSESIAIVDYDKYPNGSTGQYDNKSTFFGNCYDKIETEEQCGCIDEVPNISESKFEKKIGVGNNECIIDSFTKIILY